MGLPALPNLNIKNVTVHITSSIKLKDSTSVLLKIHAKNAEDFPDISGSDYKHDNTQTIHIYGSFSIIVGKPLHEVSTAL